MTEDMSFSRRAFLKGASAAAVAGQLGAVPRPAGGRGGRTFEPGLHEIELRVNGAARQLSVEPRTTLLDALRERLDLTGAKKICDRGACGGCTVLVDGAAVNACMLLALDALGSDITTIEGLSSPTAAGLERSGELHPLQAAFVECDALQCGFCTPGMIMAGLACLTRYPKPTREQIRHEMSGNLCRCGTFGRVFEAIEKAGGQR